MARLLLGHIPTLCQQAPRGLQTRADAEGRPASWLAGRVLLAQQFAGLPAIGFGAQGKPHFIDTSLPAFNLSHSGDYIALAICSRGAVGCDIEQMRTRLWHNALLAQVLPAAELARFASLSAIEQQHLFWPHWTAREAALKQRGDSVWAMSAELSLPDGVCLHQGQQANLAWAVCCPCPQPPRPELPL